MLIAFLLYDQIFDFLIAPYEDIANDDNVDHRRRPARQVDPLEGFGVRMKLALYGGIALAMPVILWQLWRFITPGLYPHEKRYAIPFLRQRAHAVRARRRPRVLHAAAGPGVPASTSAATTSSPPIAPGKYFTLITYMMLAFGIGFEFPIVLVFLQMVGVLTPQHAARRPPLRHRRHLRAGRGHHARRRPDQHADAVGADDHLLRGLDPHRARPRAAQRAADAA